MKLATLLKDFIQEEDLSIPPRPYCNHSIEFKKPFSAKERMDILEKVGLNVFFFPAEMITGCDLLSDSGTTTMTNEQWAALHLGDESYGSNKGYFKLLEAVRDTFGEGFGGKITENPPTSFLFHQGRPAEDVLFSILGSITDNQIIPSNGHFDTTAANIEAHKIQPLNLFSPALKDPDSTSHFKGNMDTEALERLLEKNHRKIPVIYITITNNTGGGQPVSIENMRKVHLLSREYKVPFFFDACRFAENAYFIKKYEKGFMGKPLKQIIKEMFSYVDGFTISFKKDGLVNMGGGLFLRKNGLFVKKYPQLGNQIMDKQIVKEGHPTYGGMSGRDIMALATGLKTIIKEEYLEYRVNQVINFGMKMHKYKIPVVTPIGGHAVYLDVNRFFQGSKREKDEFPGVSFTALLLGLYGHRACELGNFAFGFFNAKTKKEVKPEVNFVRFAVPRLRYEEQDLDSVVEAVKALYQDRDKIPQTKVLYGRELNLRHFKARFRIVAD